MTLFHYTAVPIDGPSPDVRKGEITGESAVTVRASLRRIGLQVVKIKPVSKPSPTTATRFSSLRNYVRNRRRLARAEMYDSVATMLESGIPLTEAIQTVAGARKKRLDSFRTTLLAIGEDLQSGHSLADAMRAHSSWFDLSEIAMIEAGQRGGHVGDVLRSLAQRHERSGQLAQKIAGALAYPAIIAIVGLFVLVFISTKTLPELSGILADAGVPIPILTERVMGLGQAIVDYWYLGAILSVGFVVAWSFTKAAIHRHGWEPPRQLMECTPALTRRLAVAAFATRMAELLKSGVPMLEALRVTAPTTRSVLFRRRLLGSADRIERGEALSDTLDDDLWFDAEFRRLLAIGEAASEVETLLEKIGKRYERRSQRLIDRCASLLEPSIILLLAVLIGVVVMAAILPVMKLQEIL